MLRKYEADLEPLKWAVARFLPFVSQRANGDCLPNKETRKIYEPVKEEALKLLDFDPPYLSEPIVRMKPSSDGGAKNSSLLHTDYWAGHDAFVVMIPIGGDFKKGGVEFFEATQNLDLLLKPYADYSQAPDFKPRSLGQMEPGFVYVLDPRCLHRTMRGERRISVDFRCAWSLDFPMSEHYASRNRS